jgi:hypothetical protein
MSRMTHISTSRSILVASIISAAALAAPVVARAQTGDGERALLNHVPAPVGASGALAFSLAAEYAISPDPVDGERALAVRVASAPVAAGNFELVAPTIAQAPTTGAYALLGAVGTGR